MVVYNTNEKDQNAIEHLAWAVGNWDPMLWVCIPKKYLTHGIHKYEIREKLRHKNRIGNVVKHEVINNSGHVWAKVSSSLRITV